MSRRYLKREGVRQNADFVGVAAIRSVGECSVTCNEKATSCVGFNFKREPPAMCELSGVTHDATNKDMVVNRTWDHYSIIP